MFPTAAAYGIPGLRWRWVLVQPRGCAL